MFPKLKQFLFVVTGLIVSKMWHDTLPIFLDLYSTNISRSLLSTYMSSNSFGMTIGGVFGGMFTDSLSPRRVFPFGMFSIFILTILLMISFEYPIYNILVSNFIFIDPRIIFLALRGICISTSMNAAYVAVGDMYKGSSALPRASAYLYTALFGALASFPLIIQYTSKNLFIFVCILNLIVPIILANSIDKRATSKVDIVTYVKSLWLLLKSREFVLACSVSMICIGSFYNLMYCFKDAYINKDLTSDLIRIQSIGRYATFFVGVLSSFSGIAFFAISNKNCAQFMYWGMGLVASGMFMLGCCFLSKDFGIMSQIIFYFICGCSGVCQPAAKASIICIAQNLGTNITGSAQSLNTFFYSFIEFLGLSIVFGLKYPNGCMVYIAFATILVFAISFSIYRLRDKINSYIS